MLAEPLKVTTDVVLMILIDPVRYNPNNGSANRIDIAYLSPFVICGTAYLVMANIWRMLV